MLKTEKKREREREREMKSPAEETNKHERTAHPKDKTHVYRSKILGENV